MDIAIRGEGPDIGVALRSQMGVWLLTAVAKRFAWARGPSDTVSSEAHRLRARVSVNPIRGMPVQSLATKDERCTAFRASLERIRKQVHRYKRRVSNRNARRELSDGNPALQFVIAAEHGDDELPEDARPTITVDIPSCIDTATVGEAVMRMGLADPPAMMLRYRTHGGLNPAYRRNDGNIGWSESAYVNEA